jgi:hypothetical protein
MTQMHHGTEPPRMTSGTWTGWVVFASIMLMINGSINIVQGLVALLQDDYFVVLQDDYFVVPSGDELLITDFTGWGIVMILWGALLALGGFGLYSGQSWARWFAIFVASLGILLQIAFLNTFPIWSAVIIGLDVLIIFALTARWDEARPV